MFGSFVEMKICWSFPFCPVPADTNNNIWEVDFSGGDD